MADENKIFAPTPRKRRQARERGQVAISPDLVSGLFLLAFTTALHFCGQRLIDDTGTYLRGSLEQVQMEAFADREQLTSHLVGQIGRSAGYFFMKLWPFWTLCVTAIVCVLVQTRGLFHWQAMTPSFARINPATGLSRFSLPQLTSRLFATTAKILGLSLIAWAWVRTQFQLERHLDLAQQTRAEFDQAIAFLFALSAGLLVWGVFDYAVRRRRLGKQLRMSARELADEHKQFQSDPAIGRQAQDLRSKFAPAVSLNRTTDLLITNGLAACVLLRFNPQTQSSPVMLEHQTDSAGVQLLQRCMHSRVPIHESIELYQELSQSSELAIPSQLWPQIAELFARRETPDSASQPAGEPERSERVSL